MGFCYSALVGMAVMIALVPVPGYVVKLIQTAQRESMRKVRTIPTSMSVCKVPYRVCAPQTDARVQTITESEYRDPH